MPQFLNPVKAATLAIGLTLSATTALACAFHSYVPEETVVDKMLGSDHIVLARPDPHNPTRFKAVDALLDCVDIEQMMIDSMTADGTPREAAECVAEGFGADELRE
ncbi:MAG: hypothetical protein ACPGFC_12505, partial [Paracoccaceae bacterium]